MRLGVWRVRVETSQREKCNRVCTVVTFRLSVCSGKSRLTRGTGEKHGGENHVYMSFGLMERRSITRPRIIWSNQILEEFLLLVTICNSSNILKIYSNHRRMKIKNFQTKTKKCRYLNYAGKFIVCPIYLFSNISNFFFLLNENIKIQRIKSQRRDNAACRFSDGWSPVVTRLNRNEMQRVGYARICPLLPCTRATFVYSRYALPICIDPSTCMQSNFIQRFEQRI